MSGDLPRGCLMQGNEAVARGALDAGARFFAGYPITPSTEIAEILAEKMPLAGGKFIQMEDEIAGLAAVIGASLAGLKALTATSGPGFSLMQENLGFACMAEVPCVVVNVQRCGPSTGIPTAPAQGDIMQARWGTHGDHPAIVLCPASVQESYHLTVQAFNFAEKYRTPVILLTDEVIGHLRERAVLPNPAELTVVDRKKPPAGQAEYQPYLPGEDGVPPLADFGSGYRYHVTGLVHDETGAPTTCPDTAGRLLQRLSRKVAAHLEDIVLTDSWLTEDAEVIVVACGSVARSARQAVQEARAAGIRAGLFRPVTLWPFPEKEVAALSGRTGAILVPEMNLGQLRYEVERAARGGARVAGLNKVNGELITPEEILEKLQSLQPGKN